MSELSRRNHARGAAWSVPAISIAGTTPALAASPAACSTASKTAIDNRLKVGCADSKLTFNIYQPIAQLSNGTATNINLNLRNDGTCNAYFSCWDPLIVKIQIHDINTACQRSITSKGTSWGTLTDDGYDSANHLWNFTWSFCGEIPASTNGDNEADLQIGLGAGAFCGSASGRQTSYMTFAVPTLKAPAAPPADVDSHRHGTADQLHELLHDCLHDVRAELKGELRLRRAGAERHGVVGGTGRRLPHHRQLQLGDQHPAERRHLVTTCG